MSDSDWWYLMRASGMVAWVLLTMTVLWGALVSSKLVRRGRRWLLDMHPFLASLGLAMLVLHVVAAVMDSYAGVSLAAVFVPFQATSQPLAMALGVVALWALVVVIITSWLRRHLARTSWLRVHQLSYVAAWTMALHSVTAGTDMNQPLVAYGACALMLVLTALSVIRALREPRPHTQAASAAVPVRVR